MSKNNKVLVLSDDDLRGRDITTILEFVGEEQVLCGDDALALLRQAGEDELADVSVAILNGEDGRVRDWVGMVCKASRSLPLLVVGDPELKGLNEEKLDCVQAVPEFGAGPAWVTGSLAHPSKGSSFPRRRGSGQILNPHTTTGRSMRGRFHSRGPAPWLPATFFPHKPVHSVS